MNRIIKLIIIVGSLSLLLTSCNKVVLESRETWGVSGVFWSESYIQPDFEGNKVDILWIVDNSKSMKEEQEMLADNFDNFIKEFVATDMDFRMGIATTSSPEFIESNGQSIIDSQMDTNVARDLFIQNINVGITGTGFEKGLEKALKALELNNDSSSNNYNFLREEAFLAVIIVTDENDISEKSTEHYVKGIQNMKMSKSMAAIYSICDTVSKSYPDPYVTAPDLDLYLSGPNGINPGAERYMNAVNNTGGFYADIHDDFATSLLEIGHRIASLRKRFPLTRNPNVKTIEVKLNNQVVTSGWKYDKSMNAIIFDVAPLTGTKVTVSFYTSYI